MQQVLGDRVAVEVSGAVASVTLSRPAAGNALDLAMVRALRDAVSLVEDQRGVRVLRLGAAGHAFCVGGDLQEFAGAADPSSLVREVADTAHEVVTRLRGLPVPVVSVVQGVTAGGGMGLAMAADIVLAARSARFRAAYTDVGLSPDCGLSHHLVQVVGPARAHDVLLTNRTLTAVDAAAWGLVSRVHDDGDLATAAEQTVARLAAGPAEALAATRALLRAAAEADLASHLEQEARSIAHLAGTADGREGVRAFLDKRRPRYGGASAQGPAG